MVQYGKNDVSDTDTIVENTMDSLIQEWGTDELIELLGECEFVLSYNAGRIDQLKANGLKRLYNFITRINRKNERIVRDNVQSIQEISLNIQKILLRRIDIVSSAYLSLNDKVNTEIFWTRDIVKKLLRKLKNVSIKEELTRWQVNVQNLRMENGSRYAEASDGVKILLVVSDIFRIVRSQTDLIDEPFLETALNDHLGIPDQIRISDFYRDIISEKCCLPLYVKEEYNYLAGNISEYGRSIYHINDFYLDYHIKEIAQQNGRTLQDMCLETYGGTTHEKDKTVRVSDLCQRLLEDLSDLDDRHQAEMKETILQESTVKPTPQELPEETVTYSVLRLTPEGNWLFRDKSVCYNKTDFKSDYSFPDEKGVKTYLDNNHPYMVTAPSGYFDKCMPEIKSILLNKTKYVSLADYYMYLWFEHTNRDVRRSKRVALIEYYAHDLYVSAYIVDKTGDSYQKESQKAIIHYNKLKVNIEKAIMSLPVFGGLVWGNANMIILKTFTADKYIDQKLEIMGVGMVDNTWEDILKTTNEELGMIINDIL